jgi:hypothetical protein
VIADPVDPYRQAIPDRRRRGLPEASGLPVEPLSIRYL